MKVFDAATKDCARGLCLHAARPRERFVRDSVWLRGREMAVVEWVAPHFKLWWCVCGTAVTVEKSMWLRVLGGAAPTWAVLVYHNEVVLLLDQPEPATPRAGCPLVEDLAGVRRFSADLGGLLL